VTIVALNSLAKSTSNGRVRLVAARTLRILENEDAKQQRPTPAQRGLYMYSKAYT